MEDYMEFNMEEHTMWYKDQVNLWRVKGADNITDFWCKVPEDLISVLPSEILEQVNDWMEIFLDEMSARGAESETQISHSKTAGYLKLTSKDSLSDKITMCIIYSDEMFIHVL